MNTLLAALEAAIERYGRGAVTDPIALAGALRSITDPPSDADVDAVVQVAGTDAVPRMRAALDGGADPGAALAAAVEAARRGGADPATAERATAALGSALGLLPRVLVTGDAEQGATRPVPSHQPPPDTAAPYRGRRVRAVAVALLAAAVVAGGAAAVALTQRPGGPPVAAASPTPAPSLPAMPSTASTAPVDPAVAADPRTAFPDPVLLAFAEPYLTDSAARCQENEPLVNMAAYVSCDLGGGRAALFARMLSADVMRDVRAGWLSGTLAQEGTVRSLRWRFVDGEPGVRTGIPAGNPAAGEGVRVRFVSSDGDPFLYFDQDSTACTAMFGLGPPTGDDAADLDTLRAYWRDPTP